MAKTVAILQSAYIPWKGYFDIIHDVDLFVFYDDVQFSKNDWRNRNLIKTQRGTEWLSIPVGPREDRLICEVRLPNQDWAARHWRLLLQHYGDAPYFGLYRPFLEDIYARCPFGTLTELNKHMTVAIAREFLGLQTEFADSRDFGASGRKLERLVDLVKKTGAAAYLSGPAAKDYIDPARFAEVGVKLLWKDYSGYPEYPQFHSPFTHQVSILDLLFHVGPDAPNYIWGSKRHQSGMLPADAALGHS